MKSGIARGDYSMRKGDNEGEVRYIIAKQAKRFGVTICDLAVLGNHFHAIVRVTRRDQFKNFLRAVAGLIPRMLMAGQKGFWKARLTRALSIGDGPTEFYKHT